MTPRKAVPATTQPNTMLRGLREMVGLSQADLAARTGYAAKTIQRWELGQGTPRLAVMECLRGLMQSPLERRGSAPAFRFVDLFAGIGGLRRSFDSIGGSCVFTSEWDKYAQVTYRANFSCEHVVAGDIVQIPSEHIPSHDILLAGFPCQPFSIAGVSKKNALGRPHGFACDTQGTLFFEVARILRFHRPGAFLLENVKNLTTHDAGQTFRTIKRVLREELGYQLHWKVLDGSSFVPQHRRRVFIIGFRDPNDFSWDGLDLPDPATGPRLASILHPEDGTEPPEAPYTDARGKVSARYCLSEHLWQYLQDYARKHRNRGNGFGFGLVGPSDVARTLSARYFKDGSEILVKRDCGTPRRLTPRECSRLMGFDGPGQAAFKINVSDTQAYRQFGNSVIPSLVGVVARQMLRYLRGDVTTATQLRLPLAVRSA